jgi:hypothetical protein
VKYSRENSSEIKIFNIRTNFSSDSNFSSILEQTTKFIDSSEMETVSISASQLGDIGKEARILQGVISEVEGCDLPCEICLQLNGDYSDGIEWKIIYRSDLFLSESMKELASQLGLLITQMVQNPHENIKEFSLVTNDASTILPSLLQELDS